MRAIIDEYGDFLLAAVIVFLVMVGIRLLYKYLGNPALITDFFQQILGNKPTGAFIM